MAISAINGATTVNRVTRRNFLQTASVASLIALLEPKSIASEPIVEPKVKQGSNDATKPVEKKDKLETVLEHLNPNLTEAIPVVVCNFYESSKLINNNFKTKTSEFEIRNSNADTFARAISGSLSYVALLASRVPFSAIGNIAQGKLLEEEGAHISEETVSNMVTMSAFHFQTMVLAYGSVPLIKMFREAYIEILQDEKYGNDPRKIPIAEVVKILRRNKEKIALNIQDDLNHIKQIPKDYVRGGLCTARGYVDHTIFALSYALAIKNTGLGRVAGSVHRGGLLLRNLIALENKGTLSYKNQVVRCSAEQITWPSLYVSNGIAQTVIDATNAIPNTDKSLGMANLRELVGNLIFMGIFMSLKTPAQRGLENHFYKKFDDPDSSTFIDKAIQYYIQPRRYRSVHRKEES